MPGRFGGGFVRHSMVLIWQAVGLAFKDWWPQGGRVRAGGVSGGSGAERFKEGEEPIIYPPRMELGCPLSCYGCEREDTKCPRMSSGKELRPVYRLPK
jgi:hypothetical protein